MLAKAEVVAGRLAEVATAVRHHRAVVRHKADVGFGDLGEEAARSDGDVSWANINSGRMNFCATKKKKKKNTLFWMCRTREKNTTGISKRQIRIAT